MIGGTVGGRRVPGSLVSPASRLRKRWRLNVWNSDATTTKTGPNKTAIMDIVLDLVQEVTAGFVQSLLRLYVTCRAFPGSHAVSSTGWTYVELHGAENVFTAGRPTGSHGTLRTIYTTMIRSVPWLPGRPGNLCTVPLRLVRSVPYLLV
jgi:hypothetical protein